MILVTGGIGFIGSHIVDQLIASNHKVVVVDDFSNPAPYRVPDGVIVYKMDIRDDDLENVFKKHKIDFCIHLAAQVSVGVSEKDPKLDCSLNIDGSINVFSLCKKYNVKKVIVSSSAAVYGNPKKLPIVETDECRPISFYGLSKLTMESYLKQFDLPYIIFRFANVYGPRQSVSGEAGVVAIFNNLMKQGSDVFIDDDGEQTRDFIFVKDIAKVVSNAIDSDVVNQTINVSSNSSISVNLLFSVLAKHTSYVKAPIYREKRPGDIKHSILNNTKLLSTGLCSKITSLELGIKDLVNFSK